MQIDRVVKGGIIFCINIFFFYVGYEVLGYHVGRGEVG